MLTDSESLALRRDIAAQSSFDGAIRTAVAGVKAARPEYDWVGVYLVDGAALTLQDDHYIGPLTIETTIALDRGICGAAATARQTLIVDDVCNDPRYIACSPTVNSEIVVPIINGDELIGVLDLDSDKRAAFGTADREYLETIAAEIAQAREMIRKDHSV